MFPRFYPQLAAGAPVDNFKIVAYCFEFTFKIRIFFSGCRARNAHGGQIQRLPMLPNMLVTCNPPLPLASIGKQGETSFRIGPVHAENDGRLCCVFGPGLTFFLVTDTK